MVCGLCFVLYIRSNSFRILAILVQISSRFHSASIKGGGAHTPCLCLVTVSVCVWVGGGLQPPTPLFSGYPRTKFTFFCPRQSDPRPLHIFFFNQKPPYHRTPNPRRSPSPLSSPTYLSKYAGNSYIKENIDLILQIQSILMDLVAQASVLPVQTMSGVRSRGGGGGGGGGTPSMKVIGRLPGARWL